MSADQRSTTSLRPLAIAALFLAVVAAAVEYWPQDSPIAWRTFAQALDEGRATGRPIYLDLYAEWCGPCKQMDRETFTEDSVRTALADRYIPARLDIDSPAYTDSLKKAWRLKGVPTSMILSPLGEEWRRRVGFQSARQMTAWLLDTTLTTSSGWKEFEAARMAVRTSKKPLLIVIADNGEQVPRVDEFFADTTMLAFTAQTFEPTLIVRTGPSGHWVDSLRALTPVSFVPNFGFLLLVLSHDGRDLGQLQVTPMELGDAPRIRQTLRGYAGR